LHRKTSSPHKTDKEYKKYLYISHIGQAKCYTFFGKILKKIIWAIYDFCRAVKTLIPSIRQLPNMASKTHQVVPGIGVVLSVPDV